MWKFLRLFPVKIGRNLSGLVEVAAMKHRAIKQGVYKSIDKIDKDLIKKIKEKI